jgi:hypothetical protein
MCCSDRLNSPPQAVVPEKSAFDLDRAKTSSEGVGLGSDPGFISSRDRRDQRFDPDGVHDAGQIIDGDRKCHLAGDFADMRHPVWAP